MAQKGKPDKAVMKSLREQRKTAVGRAKKNVKHTSEQLRKIKSEIAEKACTVPQIAQATRISADRVLYYIATLKKYGLVMEDAKDGDYFTYRQTPEKAAQA